MKEKFLKLIPSCTKGLLAVCIFIVPLVFFTNLTKNPFIVQDLLMALTLCAFLVLYSVKVFFNKEITLKYSKTDLFFLLFATLSLLSLFYNMAFDGKFMALAGEFSQKGDVFIFACFGAWFLSKHPAPAQCEKFRPNFYLQIFLWSLCWFLFNIFSGIFFYIYAALMWGWAGYICFKRLDKINLFSVSDIFLALCAVCSFYGILQNAGMEMIWQININYEFGSRAISTFGNPNFLSSYLLIFLPLAFLRFMRAKKGGERFTFLIILLSFCAYLAISMTRSSWLGVLVAGGFLLLFKKFRVLLLQNKKLSAFIIALCCGVFFLWPAAESGQQSYSSAASGRIAELQTLDGASAFSLNAPAEKLNPAYHQRLMMWACGLEMFKDSPLLGKGLASFQMNYGLCQGSLMFKNPALASLKTQANEAHNQFVQVLAEGGILGLLSFIALLFSGFYFALKNISKEKDTDFQLFYLSLIAGLIAFTSDNLLNITFRAPVTAFAFWFIFGSLNNLSSTEKTKKLKVFSAWFLLLAALFISALAAFWQASYFKAEIYSLKGLKHYGKGEFKNAISWLEKADSHSAVRADTGFAIVNSLLQTGRHKEAEESALRGIKKYPGYYEFYLRVSGVKSAFGDNLSAAEYLKKALLLYPQNLAAAQAWGKFVVGLKSLQTAENALFTEKLLHFFPYDQDLRLAYISSAFTAGDKQKACSLAAEALAFDIFNPDYYEACRLCSQAGFKNDELMQKAEKLKSARTEIKTLKITPALEEKIKNLYLSYKETPSAAMLWAEILYNKGDYAAASDLLKPYLPGNKYLKPLCFALSSSYLKLGDYEKAKEPLKAILSYDKHDEQANLRLKNIEDLQKKLYKDL